jgi:outer membrane receptor protein involved in Fe transport
VGFVIDDIDLTGIGMPANLFDIQQVEILRGPQSSIFGANAMAGLINLRSAEPTDKFGGSIHTTLATDNTRQVAFSLNTPITIETNTRFSVSSSTQDGFRINQYKNVTNSNAKSEILVKNKTRWTPSSLLHFDLSALYSEQNNKYDVWAPDNNEELKTYSDKKGLDSQNTTALSLRTNIPNLGGMELLSITSYSQNEMEHSYDGDWGNLDYWAGEPFNYYEDNLDYFSEEVCMQYSGYYPCYYPYDFFDKTNRSKRNTNTELRIYNQKAVVGIYLKNLVEKDEAEGYLFGGEGNVARANSDYDIDVKAFYAKLKSNLTKKVSIANSFRYESNDITYLGQSFGYANDTIPSVDASKRFNLNGFKSSITYNLNSYSNLFAHVSLGYKTGGVNQQPYVSTENRIYSPEYLSSYEISFKNKTDRFFTSLSYFYNDRIDQQLSISAQQNASDPNSFYYFTTNSEGKGFSRGVEIDFNAKISNRLSLKTALAYLDTWTNKFSYTTSNNNVQSGGGREAAMAPKISSSATLTYKHNLLFITLSQNYKDEYYYSDSHDQKSVPYSLLNLTLGKSFGKTTATIWIRNAMDERYTTRGFYFGLIPPTYPDELWKSYGDPRQIGVTIDYTF